MDTDGAIELDYSEDTSNDGAPIAVGQADVGTEVTARQTIKPVDAAFALTAEVFDFELFARCMRQHLSMASWAWLHSSGGHQNGEYSRQNYAAL